MKNLPFVLFSLMLPILMIGQYNIYPGMPIDEFRKEMPGKIPPVLPFNETLMLEETINSVKGKWMFQFRNNKLMDIKFRSEHDHLSWPLDNDKKRNDKITQQSKEKSEKIFSYYEDKYGDPLISNKIEFVLDPEKQNYSEILKMKTWSLSGMKIIVEYRFEGDNPEIIPMNNMDISMYTYYVSVDIQPNKGGSGNHNEKFFVGMDIKDFSKKFPEILPSGVTENGQFGFEETIHGLKGEWHYNFKNDSLEAFGFHAYIEEELNEKNFNLCLATTEKLIEKYKTVYGEPTELNIGKKEFLDPDVKRHWGYDVIEVKWKDDKKLFRIDFAFHGGKGQYFYLMKIEAYRPDYEYFD